MPYQLKRMFQFILGLSILGLAIWIIFEVRTPQEFISAFLYPTILFIPVALLAVKYKNILTSRKSACGGIGALIGMFLGNILYKSASEDLRRYLPIFFMELMILSYYIFRLSYNERNQIQQLGLQRISSNEFKILTKSLGFNRFDAWFAPATRDHYRGICHGLNTCVFSFQTNGPAYLAIIYYSDNWQLPVFQVKPKSISDDLKSMFSGNNDTTPTLTPLPPDLVAAIRNNDSVELEVTRNALFLYDVKKFTDEPENYESAIQHGYFYASLVSGVTQSPTVQ